MITGLKRFVECRWYLSYFDLLILKSCCRQTPDFQDIEVKAKNKLGAWLTSFQVVLTVDLKCRLCHDQGWGLLSSMLPNIKHRHFILALAYTSANWNESTGGEQTDEKVFDAVKAVFDAVPGKRLGNLVPDLSCWFDEVAEGGVEEQRNKYFTFFFSAKWALEVRFEVEKLRQVSPHDRFGLLLTTSIP